jgi:ABC-type transport system involved in multi-copper enzyme maturation permease subunit
MNPPGILERIGDALNPIVVKELRQAVQSRFVVALLLLFLLAQLLFMGIFLVFQSLEGPLDAADYQAGDTVFQILQAILLGTCMVFIPAYSGGRLAAERSDVNVDLLFITTLRPGAIIWGKFVAALILAVLIFSACAPFMTFTYFLRGIDLVSIFFVVVLDFLAVTGMVMLALFLAVVPATRVLKALVGLGGICFGVFALGMTYAGTYSLLQGGVAVLLENPDFWVLCLAVTLALVGAVVFLFTGAVGLLSLQSSNRTMAMRLAVTVFCLVTGVPVAWYSNRMDSVVPMLLWILEAGILFSLCLVIAVNEREHWAPRVARTIPRRWWLRPLAFLFYSGAGGGVLWVSGVFAACWLTLPLLLDWGPSLRMRLEAVEYLQKMFKVMAVLFGYTYCYALSAVFLRNTLIKIQPVYTWVLALALLALGCVLPFLVVFLVHYRDWNFWTHYTWLLTNPWSGMLVVGDNRMGTSYVVMVFVLCWAAIVTGLNVPWFIKQMRRFRPYAGSAVQASAALPSLLSAAGLEATRTAP